MSKQRPPFEQDRLPAWSAHRTRIMTDLFIVVFQTTSSSGASSSQTSVPGFEVLVGAGAHPQGPGPATDRSSCRGRSISVTRARTPLVAGLVSSAMRIHSGRMATVPLSQGGSFSSAEIPKGRFDAPRRAGRDQVGRPQELGHEAVFGGVVDRSRGAV
jgi:hypothetical protein